ncbi:MAG: ATP-dependent helicase [Candidatus Omnitrophica bacterium]|nr:ATP-dependent helicase [Candidatus Omnitrophota bacterium]MDD5436165.1 ATP-dependent helicase [Candidatus Omnitrophota bacterium]
MLDLKDKLNPSQLSAVSTTEGPVLVIAGAGSGKTRAIEYRVLNLVTKGVAPQSILLLTFTRKAAHEMISRASRHDPRCRHVDGGTFHSFAFRTLKKYAKALGLSSQFSILDESDSQEAVHRCALKLNLLDKEAKFPRKDTLKNILSMSLNKGRPINGILEKEYPHFLKFAAEIESLRKEYASYKIGKNYLDYDDLLVYLKLLLEIEEVRKAISSRYRYVMVDEYQDTNALQGDIAYLLAADHNNIMAVGDDAQSIYGFRGSSHRNIMEFPKKFDECKIIKLEENYRSTQNILDVANSVLESMDNKYSKCLVSTREEAGDRARLNFFKNNYDEAEWIVDKIRKLQEEGVGLESQAVLFRSAYVSISLQAELSKNGIPYQVFGGLKFYETAHVKDIIAHLKIILNPKDEIAWHRVLTTLDGVGPKTADKITEAILARTTLEDIIEKALGNKNLPVKASMGIARLKKFLKSAGGGRDEMDVAAVYDKAFDYYSPIFKIKFDDWNVRINDLEALRQISGRYDSLEELLADFAIEPPDRGVLRVEPKANDDEKPLTLSTIHSAKGLEWDTVFIIGLIDGVMPSSFSLDNDEEIEEESRLFYVGITRAKNRLFLSLNHEGTRGGITQFNKVSRFVEIPNVQARLDQTFAFEEDPGGEIDLDDSDGITPFYDKRSLLAEIIGRGEKRPRWEPKEVPDEDI